MKDTSENDIDTALIAQALRSVTESKAFEDVHRLRAFLEYAVATTLNDSQRKIPAKLIAADVYKRQTEEGTDPEAVVRVDAGRLRRRLELYYATEGASDPVLISIPKGGYTPSFETNPQLKGPKEQETRWFRSSRLLTPSLVFALAAFGGVGFLSGWLANSHSESDAKVVITPTETTDFDADAEVRLSISQVSSASLLARTFVEEARHLTFPSIDPARPMAAEILCKRAIQMAPDLATGHSCDAFVQAFFAFLSPPGTDKDTRLDKAQKNVKAALRIDPSDPFSLMAAAWTKFAGGQRVEAIDEASVAVKLDTSEPFLRSFYGMMMVFEGRGAELLSTDLLGHIGIRPDDLYHPFIVASAKLQSRDYDGVIAAVEEAVALEGRTSQLITAIQISALENLGQSSAAEKLAQNMHDTWRIRDVRGPLVRLYSRTEDVEAIANPLEVVFSRIGLQVTANN